MSLSLVVAASLLALAIGYRTFGSWVAGRFGLDPQARTPAVCREDGVDFAPTKPAYLFGQHFSAIAAAGPIAGPILAGQQFGWLAALLWIVVGAVFIGAVHDFATLVASVRHDARSIAEVIRAQLGPRAGAAMTAFIWIALVYVIVAFADITASTFVAGDEALAGARGFDPGGAVAMAAVLYLALAMLMGLCERYLRLPLWLLTVIFVPATLGAVHLGTELSTVLRLDATTWAILILAYCVLASLAPVWLLLQPRGYLGGIVLYLALAIGVVGVFFGDFPVVQEPFRGFEVPGGAGLLFPFLFVTIACGACSGFHGLVCSGTTSRQIAKEPHCKPVGYGAMLLEGLVAVIALATVMIAAPADLAGKTPGAIYGAGLGQFLVRLIGEEHLPFAITFGAMAFSTFVFDTLDVATRLGRYLLEELLGLGALVATAATAGVPLAFVLLAGSGAWKAYWLLFGTSNQLLAALSLLGVTVWMKRSGRAWRFMLVPTAFVSAVTWSALVLQIGDAFAADGATAAQQANGVVSLVLLALAIALTLAGTRALLRPVPAVPSPDAAV